MATSDSKVSMKAKYVFSTTKEKRLRVKGGSGKTAMMRVEGENSRLRHCAHSAHRRCSATSGSGEPRLRFTKSARSSVRRISIARLHRKTFCYSKSLEMLEASIRLLIFYLKHWSLRLFGRASIHCATPYFNLRWEKLSATSTNQSTNLRIIGFFG